MHWGPKSLKFDVFYAVSDNKMGLQRFGTPKASHWILFGRLSR